MGIHVKNKLKTRHRNLINQIKYKNQAPKQIPKPKCLPPKIANAQLPVMTARAVANAAPLLTAVAIPVNAVSYETKIIIKFVGSLDFLLNFIEKNFGYRIKI